MKNNSKPNRPDLIIFTDKDGTLNLDDKYLNDILIFINNMNGMIVPITGRTIGDIKEKFETNKLKMPEFFIGDNGGSIYSVFLKKFLLKKSLNLEKVKNILDKFISLGGKEENVRFTDGMKIYVIKTPNVQKYYCKNHSVKYFQNIETIFTKNTEFTKITVVGTQNQMLELSEFCNTLDFWTDIGATKFPNANNYRLDISSKNINKGNAVKLLVSMLNPKYGYLCIGNGENDITMFKQALNDGMLIGVMSDSPENVLKEIKEYLKSSKGKLFVIPNNENKANRYLKYLAKYLKSNL